MRIVVLTHIMNTRTVAKSRTTSTAYTFIVLALLFFAAWLPRALQLDTFVTPDERRWLTRSANYYTAITHSDLESTMQTDHPGVTVMWAGALGFALRYPEYVQENPEQLSFDRFELRINEYTEHKLLDLLVAGRWWIALSVSLLLALSFLPLREVFGAKPAVVGVLFMAWDPFHIALSRFLHLDGLLTAILTFSLLSFIAWSFGEQKARYLVISGIAFGLATLTKLPAVFLAPSIGFLALLTLYNKRKQNGSATKHVLIGIIIWGIIAVGTFALLWPALWLDPIGVITELVTGASTYADGHELPNFFMGEVTNDPGPLFYPVAYLFRTTPIILVGLVMAFLMVTRKKWPFNTDSRRLAVIGMTIFAVVFTLGLMTVAKKFDRYLLPIFLPLDIVAALGWAAIAKYGIQWWRRYRASKGTPVVPQSIQKTSMPLVSLLAMVVLLQGLFAFNHSPYYLTYYNPIMGGNQKAKEVLMVGWGDGLDQVAAWINEQEGASQAQVVSWYQAGPLSYFLDSEKRPLPYWYPDFWFEADYAVTYINQWQREIPDHDTIAYLEGLEPVHTVSLKGLEMARIYDLRHISPPKFTHISTVSAAQCNDYLDLSAYQQEGDSFVPGESTKLTLFLKTLSTIEQRHRLVVQLKEEGGETIWQREQAVGIASDLLPFVQFERIELHINIPSDAVAGLYTLSVACLEPESVSDTADVSRNVTTLTVLPVSIVDLEAKWAGYQLETLQHQPQIPQGQTLRIALFAGGDIDGTMKISTRLLDDDGATITQWDKTLKQDMEFSLSIPDDLAPDRYDIAVIVYDPESLKPKPDLLGNEIILLSTVEVVAQ